MKVRNIAIGGLVLVAVAVTAIVLVLRSGTGTGEPASETTANPPLTTCMSRPSSCGFPDSTNTGVADAATLQSVPGDSTSGQGWEYDDRGWISANQPGAVVENLDITVPIDVIADSVTIRNVRIQLGGETWGIALRHVKDVTIENVQIGAPIDQPRLLVGIKDIYGDSTGTTIRNSDVSGTGTAVQIIEGLVEGCYIHDLRMQEGDHVNGVTSNGASLPLIITNNTIANQFGQTDAVGLFQDFGVEANRTVVGNLLAGGGYTVYGGQNPGASAVATNIIIKDNRFSRIYFPNGGFYGPVTAFRHDAPGNQWTNNVWDETGEPVELG